MRGRPEEGTWGLTRRTQYGATALQMQFSKGSFSPADCTQRHMAGCTCYAGLCSCLGDNELLSDLDAQGKTKPKLQCVPPNQPEYGESP